MPSMRMNVEDHREVTGKKELRYFILIDSFTHFLKSLEI